MSNQPTVFGLRPPCYPYRSLDFANISYLVATYEVLMLLLSWPNIVSTGLSHGLYYALKRMWTPSALASVMILLWWCIRALSRSSTTPGPSKAPWALRPRSTSWRKFSKTDESTPPSMSCAPTTASWVMAARRLIEYGWGRGPDWGLIDNASDASPKRPRLRALLSLAS